jgi:chitin-binding protein
VAVYRPSNLKFSGIKADGVVVATDLSTMTLSWEAASSSLGEVEYLVYIDGNFTAQTKSLTYTFPKPIPGRTYRISVRARDDFELENNTAAATVAVPIPASFAGCSSAVAQTSATVKILFAYPLGADRMEIYRNGSLVQSTSNSSDTSLTDSGLAAATTYTYTCNAIYGSTVLVGTQSRTATTP